MKNTTILIFLKSRKNTKGECPIYLRLTVDGKRKESSLNRSILASRWNNQTQCGKGRTEDVKILNKYLNSVKETIYKYQQEMIYNDLDVTAETLMNNFLGKGEKQRYLIEIIKDENKRIKNLVSDGTYRKYLAFLTHIKGFLRFQYKVSDINIKKMDYQFVSDFDYYLRSEKSIGNNTAVRYVKTLQKFFNISKNKGWVNSNPFVNYKVTLDNVVRIKLTEAELKKIIEKDFKIERLNRIRDIFVFACHTGLSFCDLEKLNSIHVVIGMNGKKWIKINRSKTGVLCSIPLLRQAKEILEKYKYDPTCLNKGILLPVISNERYNSYLKEIVNLCGIHKNLTTHVARHTFATTITAEKGVSTEVISKMLGHTQLKTTQIYSRITDIRIAKDMACLLNDENNSENELKDESQKQSNNF